MSVANPVTKTFNVTGGESDWLVLQVQNDLPSNLAGATYEIGLESTPGETVQWVTATVITPLNSTQVLVQVLVGPAGTFHPTPGRYHPQIRVTKSPALFSFECPADIVIVN